MNATLQTEEQYELARAAIAALAMAGLMASSDSYFKTRREYADAAVDFADELLQALGYADPT